MKIKLTLAPEDAAIVHDMFLKDDMDDIGVVGLTVLDDNDIVALEVWMNPDLLTGRGVPKILPRKMLIKNVPKKVILEVRENHSSFDGAAFLDKLSDALMHEVVVKSIGGATGTPEGNTSIEVEMTPVEIMRLLKAYKDGYLDDLNIAIIVVAHFFYDNLPLAGGSKNYWKEHYADLLFSGRNDWTRKKNTRKKEEKH